MWKSRSEQRQQPPTIVNEIIIVILEPFHLEEHIPKEIQGTDKHDIHKEHSIQTNNARETGILTIKEICREATLFCPQAGAKPQTFSIKMNLLSRSSSY